MTLNIENIRKVRDHIAGLAPERFDMRFAFARNGQLHDEWLSLRTSEQLLHPCNTAACIAGWACAVLAPTSIENSSDDAALLFGLSPDAGDELFMPPGYGEEGRYTQAQAVRTLTHLIDHYEATGEVVIDWSVGADPGGAVFLSDEGKVEVRGVQS